MFLDWLKCTLAKHNQVRLLWNSSQRRRVTFFDSAQIFAFAFTNLQKLERDLQWGSVGFCNLSGIEVRTMDPNCHFTLSFVQVVVKHPFQSKESVEQTVAFEMYSAIKATYLSITNVTTEKSLSYRNVTYKGEPLSHQKFWFFTVFLFYHLC